MQFEQNALPELKQDEILREQDNNSVQQIIFGDDPMPMSDDDIWDGDWDFDTENEGNAVTDGVFDLKEDIAKIEIIFCPKCKKMTTTEFRICPDCGAKLR